MQLQNQENNQKLQTLISAANEAIASFNQVQEKANVLKTNIDRNKKMIEALQSENEELQAKSDKVTVSETGEVNFSEFDDFSDQIFANVRKIKALENVISKFEKELELLVLDDLSSAFRGAELHISNLYDFYGKNILLELLDEATINKLNIAFYLLRKSRTSNKVEPSYFITNSVKEKLDLYFEAEPSAINNLLFPKINNYNIYGDNRPWIRQKIINDLKKELGKE